MKQMVIGYKYREYPSKKTGKLVKGYEVYAVRPIVADVPCGGCAWYVQYGENAGPTRPMWVPVQLFEDFSKSCNGKVVGSYVEFFYNQFGTLEKIAIIKE